jgi:hypothetical protein
MLPQTREARVENSLEREVPAMEAVALWPGGEARDESTTEENRR